MTTEDLISITTIGGILAIVAAIAAGGIIKRYRTEFIVIDGFTGVLYHEGKLITELAAGRHVRWGRNFRLAYIDIRKALVQIPGQEVLTADNVAVKLSLVLTTQVVDAIRNVQGADNASAHVYSAAQTALRFVVAGVTMEALLTQRAAIGAQMLELLAPQADSIGLRVHAVEVRDVMLPGELRKAFSESLKAKQEGLAALERARAESASLRNLANAARLVEGLPALATLRFLQTLEGKSQTIVMNDLSAFAPVRAARGAKASTAATDETQATE